MKTRLLLLSNGHGEDAIGAGLATQLRAIGFEVEALPIVGLGEAYRSCEVPIITPTWAMPSGGFILGRPRALVADLTHGLVGHTLAQWQAVGTRAWDGIVAVGDIVPMLFAWHSRLPYVFVACAKSDHYLGGRAGSHAWHERYLMRHPRCLAVYPRDTVTTQNLLRAGVKAHDLGNPMMDGLTPTGLTLPGHGSPTIALVPGSRPQEASRNLRLLAALTRDLPPEARILAAIAPHVVPDELPGIHLVRGGFADVAHACDLAIAMAGTATEQLVGLGKPVLTVPGEGPQFTPAFAEAQSRLLGPSVIRVPSDPQVVARTVLEVLSDPPRLQAIIANGRVRMGTPGAAQRIADAVARLWNPSGS